MQQRDILSLLTFLLIFTVSVMGIVMYEIRGYAIALVSVMISMKIYLMLNKKESPGA